MPDSTRPPDLIRYTIPEIWREIRLLRALSNRVLSGGLTPAGADLTLSGGLTADHASVGQTASGTSGLTVGASGALLKQLAIFWVSWTPAPVAANSTSTQTVAVPGLSSSDLPFLATPAQPSGLVAAQGFVYSANLLAVVFANVTAGSLTPAPGVYAVLAVRS